jgi:AsmA protein
MPKFLKILLSIIVLVVIAGLAAPFFIPTNVYRDQIISAVERATGRTLTIDGDITLRFRPNVEFTVGDVTLSNAKEATDPLMIDMERMTIAVEWQALLKRQIVISKFILDKPMMSLEVLKSAKGNWEFEPMTPAKDNTRSDSSEDLEHNEADSLSFGDMHINQGKLTYRNGLTGESYEITNVNAKIELPDLQGPFKIKGDLTYLGEALTIDLGLGSLHAIPNKVETSFYFNLKSALIDAELDGTFTGGTSSKIKAASKVQVPSVRNLASWLGSPIAIEKGFGPLSVKGDLYATGSLYSFTDAAVAFDDMKGTGSLTVKNSGEKPIVSGRLNVDKIDIRPYMKGTAKPVSKGKKDDLSWNEQPFDLSAIKTIDVNFALKTRSLFFQDYEVGETDLSIRVRGNTLLATLNKLALYQGTGSGSLSFDVNQPTIKVAANFGFKEILAAPLIAAATKKEFAEGTGDLDFSVTTMGRSQKDLMKGLTGSGSFELRDGKLLGADLTRMLQIAAAFSPAQRNQDQGQTNAQSGAGKATDFVEMGSTFKIVEGVLKTKDFLLINEVLSLTGSGKVDLGRQKIDMRIVPGQRQDDGGTRIAMKVQGPWDNIKYVPDFETAIKNKLKEILIGGGKSTKDEEKTDGEAVLDLLDTLFGGGDD